VERGRGARIGSASLTLLMAFATGFAVVKASDLVFLVNGRGPHIVKNPAVGLIQSAWYGSFQFGVVAAAGTAIWYAFERQVLRRFLPPEPPVRPLAVGGVAVALVGLGLGMGWRLMLVLHDHVSWCFLLYGTALFLVALLLRKRDLLAFFVFSLAGSVGEWFVLNPSIGWWTFSQTDLFGRVPAWEPFVYGWAGIVCGLFAEGMNQAGQEQTD
jgi:hypothetical protein